MTGKLAPDTVKPAPVTDAELMINGAVPEDVRVTDCGAELVFKATLPKFRLDVLSFSPGTDAPRPML